MSGALPGLDTPSSPRTTLSVPGYARYTGESGGRKGAEGLAAAAGLSGEVIAWLRDHYREFGFWAGRDLVWAMQSHLGQVISERGLRYSVINDYPVLPGAGRARSAGLVIRDADKAVLVAVEFKYEPSHRRADLLPAKLPAVFWGTTAWQRT